MCLIACSRVLFVVSVVCSFLHLCVLFACSFVRPLVWLIVYVFDCLCVFVRLNDRLVV